ncbi:MAG: hypothetical protein JWN68_992 [Nocardioides sp.]|jgi:rifampin ADP-ribosylating transferase|nr:hypothetical protein [Nocardioides sp.]
MSDTDEPVPFEVYRDGVWLHGTKADLPIGAILSRGGPRTSRTAG